MEQITGQITGQWLELPTRVRTGVMLIALLTVSASSIYTLILAQSAEHLPTDSVAQSNKQADIPAYLPQIEPTILYQQLSDNGATRIDQQGEQLVIRLHTDISHLRSLLLYLRHTAHTTASYRLQLSATAPAQVDGDIVLTQGQFHAFSGPEPWPVPTQNITATDSLPIIQTKQPTSPCLTFALPEIKLLALWPTRNYALILLNNQQYRLMQGQVLESGWKLQRTEATSATFSFKIGEYTCLHRIPLAVAI